MNPFRKFLTTEDLLQEAVLHYISTAYPAIFVYHIPNEGKRTSFEQFKAKVLGVRAGVPDLHIPSHNLYIELKTRKGRLTLKQKETQARLRQAGCNVITCYGLAQAKKCLDTFLQ